MPRLLTFRSLSHPHRCAVSSPTFAPPSPGRHPYLLLTPFFFFSVLNCGCARPVFAVILFSSLLEVPVPKLAMANASSHFCVSLFSPQASYFECAQAMFSPTFFSLKSLLMNHAPFPFLKLTCPFDPDFRGANRSGSRVVLGPLVNGERYPFPPNLGLPYRDFFSTRFFLLHFTIRLLQPPALARPQKTDRGPPLPPGSPILPSDHFSPLSSSPLSFHPPSHPVHPFFYPSPLLPLLSSSNYTIPPLLCFFFSCSLLSEPSTPELPRLFRRR